MPALCFYIGMQYQSTVDALSDTAPTSIVTPDHHDTFAPSPASVTIDPEALQVTSEPFYLSGKASGTRYIIPVLVASSYGGSLDWSNIENLINAGTSSVAVGDYDPFPKISQGTWKTQFDIVQTGAYKVVIFDFGVADHPVVATAQLTIPAAAVDSAPVSTIFTASPASGTGPLSVTFTAGESAGDESIDFGDGQQSKITSTDGANRPITHTYSKSGTYIAFLYRTQPSMTLGTKVISVGQ